MCGVNAIMGAMDYSKEMTVLLKKYDSFRGMEAAQCKGFFWDAIVFSVSDEAQKNAIERQIEKLEQSKSIPLVEYVAIEDVADYKMGSGGATMHILSELHSLWGSNLFSKKILLIHTGGQSRRLPQHSALGKLFAQLPGKTMLDLKLAMYLPFCEKMKSGVFLTASDDIETYAIDGDFKVKETGFTVLAHPSSLDIAKGHGVYVLPEGIYANCTNSRCIRVLQKPSLEQMKAADAILSNEFAFTDSAYMFGSDVMKCLIEYYELNRPLNKEICAYGDFLTCLGDEASEAKDPLQREIQAFPISVIVLPKSTFYHIGTLTEYLDHFCSDILFKKQLDLGDSSSLCLRSRQPSRISSFGRYVIEYCDFSGVQTLVIGKDCILWGCEVISEEIQVPDSVIIFTVAVEGTNNERLYVTLCFGITDDLKSGTKLFGKTEVGNLWEAKLFTAAESRNKSFLTTLKDIREPFVQNQKFSMEDVLRTKCIDDILEFQANIMASGER